MAHTHIITDHDDHFIIDPVTRKIYPETPAKNKLVRLDHNCERYTFEIPRYVEGHDVTQCNSIKIHYINISSDISIRNSDVYEVDDLGVLETDSNIAAFTWLISRNATMYSGTLNFAIEFQCATDGIVEYAWHTGIYSAISIGEVIVNDEIVIEEYSDIIEKWRNDLFGIGDSLEQSLKDVSLAEQNAIIARSDEIIRNMQVLSLHGPVVVSANVIESSESHMWGEYVTMDEKTYIRSCPTDASAGEGRSAIVKVKPGEKYYVTAYRGYYSETMFFPLIVATYCTNDENAGYHLIYEIKHDYSYESIEPQGNTYIIEIPDGSNYLLVNSSSAILEVSRILNVAEEIESVKKTNESMQSANDKIHNDLSSNISALMYLNENGYKGKQVDITETSESPYYYAETNEVRLAYAIDGATSGVIDIKPGEKYIVQADKSDDPEIDHISPPIMGSYSNEPGTVKFISPHLFKPIESNANFYVVECKGDPSKFNYLHINSYGCDIKVYKLTTANPNIKIDLTSYSKYDVNTYYPITGTPIPKGSLYKIHAYSTFDTGDCPSWATHANGFTCNMEVYDKGESWGQMEGGTIATDCSWKHTNQRPCGYVQMTHSSTPVILLRGGGIYYIETDYESEWTIHTDTYTYMGETVRPMNTAAFKFNRNTIFANLDGDVTGKLNGHTLNASVPSNAKFTDTIYTHPTTSGNKHVPSGGSEGQILRWNSNGTAVWGNEKAAIIAREFTVNLSGVTVAAGETETLNFNAIPVIQDYEPIVAIPEVYVYPQSTGSELQIAGCKITYEETPSLQVIVRNVGDGMSNNEVFVFKILYSAI